MSDLFQIYNSFLAVFPHFLQPYVSFTLGILLVLSIVQIVRRQFVWLIVLIILLPASVPILQHVGSVLLMALKYLFGGHTTA